MSELYRYLLRRNVVQQSLDSMPGESAAGAESDGGQYFDNGEKIEVHIDGTATAEVEMSDTHGTEE